MTTNITSARQVPKPACAYRVQRAVRSEMSGKNAFFPRNDSLKKL